jgi:hypothetical protein
MSDVKTKFTHRFDVKVKSYGVRLDILDNIDLFRTQKSIESLMKFLKECNVKFLNLGQPFATLNCKEISAFAIDERILTAAVVGEDFTTDRTIGRLIELFNDSDGSAERAKFTIFCNSHSHWLDDYALFRAIVKQTGGDDFTKWPSIIRVHGRKSIEIAKRQLQDSILFYKILQFFALKQIKLIKRMANEAGIFLCADCDILRESLCADVWSDQKLFFVDEMSKASVFTGLPASEFCPIGVKTAKVPYRIAQLQSSNYAIFGHMFANLQSMFDAIFLLNGHAIFQYWEVACAEANPKFGRWVSMPTDTFFSHLDANFNNFPYIFDFNEPLFPNNEVVAKRHSILQMVVHGEPNSHFCKIYDLQRNIFALASKNCDRKIHKIDSADIKSTNDTKACIEHFQASNYGLCILHFSEICKLIMREPSKILTNPIASARTFVKFTKCPRQPEQ